MKNSDDQFVSTDQEDRRDATKWTQLAMLPLQDHNSTPAMRLCWLVLNLSPDRLSKDDLSRATGLAYSTVVGTVGNLHEAGLVEEYHQESHKADLYEPAITVRGAVNDAVEEAITRE